MQSCVELRNPTLVAAVRGGDDTPFELRTRYELVCRLRELGWQWRKLPRGARKQQEVECRAGSPKV
eukprot:8266115-Heterocapsa_arctica.AAC.1